MAKNYYETLGVEKNASDAELKSAYRKQAKKYHPDLFATAGAKEKADAEAKFKDVQHAYEVLSDGNKRATYDQFGTEDPQQNGGFGGGGFGGGGFSGFGGGGFNDIFGDIFGSAFGGGGGGSSRGRTSARQGDDIEVTLNLTFKEACFGVEKDISYSRIEKCGSCNGTGAKNGSELKTCSKCGGSGRIVVNQRTVLGMMQSERACDMCGGSGKIIVDKCHECNGKGKQRKNRTTKIKIPAGVDNGQMLTVQGGGNAGTNGGSNGNLIIVFRVQSHPIFEREGVNLHMELPITVTDAILGTDMDIPTLQSPVKINIAEGTQDGTVIRVKGKGVKHLKRDMYGDLYVKVTVDVPKSLSMRQRKQLKELQDVLGKCRYDKIDKYNKKLREL
ncbi:MAG: molecular chaperone DnaJ [Bacillota bacterium]